GAAASAPKPPCSISTTTTTRGCPYGAQVAYHEWSLPVGVCAVPVLPATGIGKELKTEAEVPTCAASYRPCLIAHTSFSCTRARGRERSVRSTRPDDVTIARPTCGRTIVPPFASAEYATASCSGVTARYPCPIDTLTE